MDYIATITKNKHLNLHFSFYNKDEAAGVYVPRLLGPLGYFIELEISNENDEVVYETYTPKIKLKLNPEKQESYQLLDVGYIYGSVLKIEDFDPASGTYKVSLKYSNQEFSGFADNPLDEMTYETQFSFDI